MAPSVTATDDQKAPADELSKIDLNASTERRCVGRCDMELGDVTHHNVQQLKRLNQAVFPVSYNDKFYKEIVSAGELAKLGIGTLLLKHVIALCEKDPSIDNIYLHVQVNNESALDFYKRFGFEIVGTAEKYYKRIEPDSAYILVKKVAATSH
ncbi:unnamed protein product [Toxocara canis]|uniref:N-terminal methionine N(alpha)-acetyltransferase NatE n=1 Tax=Toxocara canis TaxID=6265 RepID=A0A183UKL1_TOXCA|nr:unnamed protein product [Toxocara canis]